jgi:mono/diheme cytochrome c family protein
LFLAEAGNLSGDPGGPMFRAYDKQTGVVIAEIELPSKATGAPMTYLHKGRQYIVIAVATREHPAELVALALPMSDARGQALALRREATDGASAVVIGVNLEDLRAGREVYARSCAACHGPRGEGVSGSTSPLAGQSDLKYIRSMVIQGSIKMPPMRAQLTKRQIEQVSRLVAVELNKK